MYCFKNNLHIIILSNDDILWSYDDIP